MNRLYIYFIKRYGILWFIINYYKIFKCEKTIKELSKIWKSQAYFNFLNTKTKINFNFSQFSQICLDWENKKPMNYQNRLNELFRNI